MAKIEGTRERDRRQVTALEDAGWTVLRYRELEEALAAPADNQPRA